MLEVMHLRRRLRYTDTSAVVSSSDNIVCHLATIDDELVITVAIVDDVVDNLATHHLSVFRVGEFEPLLGFLP